LVESYALDSGATRAANISTRGHVGAGDEALIGGFIIGGSDSKNILVRAIGPSLEGADALANPLVEVYDSGGKLITTNDNWNTSVQQGEIVATGIPPTDTRESALIATLAPGNYTAVVRGADGGVGLGLVEVYDLSP
jgi:hypothetical protein